MPFVENNVNLRRWSTIAYETQFYTVNFNSNGGSAVTRKIVAVDSIIARPADPVKDGYIFIGWFIDAGLNNAYDFGSLVMSDMTLHAKWEQLRFNDVPENAWFADAVKYVYGKGLMIGVAEDKFDPNGALTRAMIVTILYRLAGEPEINAETAALNAEMSDVKQGVWYYDALQWGLANGIVLGYSDGRFGPNDPVTKEQLAALIFRMQQAYGQTPPDAPEFEKIFRDADEIGWWAKASADALNHQGLFNDIPDDDFKPRSPASRAEIASVLYRYLLAIS